MLTPHVDGIEAEETKDRCTGRWPESSLGKSVVPWRPLDTGQGPELGKLSETMISLGKNPYGWAWAAVGSI